VRAAVRLRDEGKTYKEIGEALGITWVAAWKLTKRWTEWVHERRTAGIS
jgi:hypothetical protein